MYTKKILMSILICILSVVFIGCDVKYDDVFIGGVDLHDSNNFNDVENDDINKKQVLKLSMANPKTLNPLLNEDSRVNNILKIIYAPLVEIDEKDMVVSGIASSWNFHENETTLTMVLKDNLIWEDGMPITADDVVYSFRTIQNATEASLYKNVLNYIRNISKVSENTIQVEFSHKFSNNLAVLNFPIIQNNTSLNSKNIPVASGAYKVSKYVEASHITLVPNTNYNGALATIPEIYVEMTVDYDTDITAFEQNMIDLLIATDIDLGKYAHDDNRNIYRYVSRDYDFIGFNFNNPMFKNKYMRQAVAYAFPKENILDTVYLGYGVMTHTPIHPNSWIYEENVVPYSFDINMSKTILKNNGWVDSNGDNVLEQTVDGIAKDLEISILINEESMIKKQIANRFQSMLMEVGFRVTIDSVPFDTYQNKFMKKDYDIVIASWKMSKALNLSEILHSTGRINYIGYNDSETDLLLNSAYSAVGEEEKAVAYSRLQQRLADELPYISIAYRSSGLVINDGVGGIISPVSENPFKNIELWNFNK